MKKWLGIFLGLMLIASPAFALGGLTVSSGTITSWSDEIIGPSGIRLLQISYVTASSGGTFTVITDHDINGWILKVQTDPGATAPTGDYDIDLDDANGEDIMGGALEDRSATVTESSRGLLNGNYQPVENYGTITIQVTTAGNSKTIEILIWYLPF